MASLKQENKNQTIKVNNEVENYLLRIIQRYFDTEFVYTQESIESMIVESLTRFKHLIIHEKGFIFSLNQMTGHLNLSIRDFGGEPAFEKKSAFNKDFGTEADTICEGNDERLFDERESLEHNHDIGSVNGLKERLEEFGIKADGHIHKNKNILDLLKYTGSKTQIDLIVLEELKFAVDEYYKNLEAYQDELKTLHEADMEQLSGYIELLIRLLNELLESVNNTINWLQDAYDYTTESVLAYQQEMMKLLSKYLTKEQIQDLIDIFSNTYHVMADGEIALTAGTFSITPVEESVIINASSEEGDSLKTIFDEGLRLNDTGYWSWNTTNNSFEYTYNEQTTYPMFISLAKFDKYTHKVLLSSVDEDDDCISVVLAYDEETGNHLSLLCSNYSVAPSAATRGAHAAVVLNYPGSYTMEGDLVVDWKKLAETSSYAGWNTITGMYCLIKRDGNNFKIWVSYNADPGWPVTETNGIKEIIPETDPDFDFNMTDYPELACFCDKKCGYGYGTFSQPYSTYKEVFVTGNASVSSESFGHTNINEIGTAHKKIYATTWNKIKNPKARFYFKYEQNGEEIVSPLPYCFTQEDGHLCVIQAICDESGNLDIQTNLVNNFPVYITEANYYDDKTIIAATNAVPDGYNNIQERLLNVGSNLCLIDSAAKNAFVLSLLKDNVEYYIQGVKRLFESEFVDSDENPLTYFDWDAGQPVETYSDTAIKININKKWEAEDDIGNKLGYVAECKLKRLTDYFTNPRIYYQILGTQEVTV